MPQDIFHESIIVLYLQAYDTFFVITFNDVSKSYHVPQTSCDIDAPLISICLKDMHDLMSYSAEHKP